MGKDVSEDVYRTQKKRKEKIEPMWAECGTISNDSACRMCLVYINAHLKISHSR